MTVEEDDEPTLGEAAYTQGMTATSEQSILDQVEKYASTPRNGRYPTDAQCDAYEAKLRAKVRE